MYLLWGYSGFQELLPVGDVICEPTSRCADYRFGDGRCLDVNRLTRENENRKWRRDRCLEAYSDFLHAVEMAISEVTIVYGLECGTEKHAKQREVAFNKVAEMHRTGSRITLLAPDALQSHFAALAGYIGKEFFVMSFQCPKASVEERKAANEKLSNLMAAGSGAAASMVAPLLTWAVGRTVLASLAPCSPANAHQNDECDESQKQACDQDIEAVRVRGPPATDLAFG